MAMSVKGVVLFIKCIDRARTRRHNQNYNRKKQEQVQCAVSVRPLRVSVVIL